MTEQNLDLRVRATIEGKKDLAGVAKSISEISDAIDKQSDAAKKGQRVNDQLSATQAALGIEFENLKSTLSKLESFQAYNKKVADAEKSVTKATTALGKYLAELEKQDSTTDANEAQLTKLAKTEAAAIKRLADRRAEQSALGDELRQSGLDANDYAASQAKIIDLQLQESQVRAKVNKELKEYSANVSAGQAAEKAANEERNRQLTEHANRVSVLNAQITASNKAASAQQAASAKEAADDVLALNATVAASNKAVADAAQVQSAKAARNAEVAANARADDEARAQVARNQELAALRKDIQERSAVAADAAATATEQAKASKNLDRLATDAEASVKAFTTLEKASNNLRPNIVSLRSAVDEIIDPAKAMRTTLSGVEDQIDKLADAVKGVNGPVENYRDTLSGLEASQKALTKQSGLVDDYKRQAAAVKQTRAEFVAANAEVLKYAAAVRQGGADSAQMVASLAKAQATQKAVTAALQADLAARRESYAALQAAGLATGSLATTQDRLTAAARKSVGTMEALTRAAQDYGLAQDKAATPTKGSGFFDADGGRTTLSLIQRLKGEVLALTAAYVGLYGVIDTAMGSIRASGDETSVKNQLSLAVGENEALIDAEYEYVKAQSKRIGQEYNAAALGYAKLVVGIKANGKTMEEARYIFESFSEVARVAGLSGYELEGVFRAIGQSYSKTKIQGDELLQLSERIPGVLAFAQAALKKQFPDLQKALAEGKVSSEYMLIISQKFREFVKDRLGKAIEDTSAQQARFRNEIENFQKAIAKGGWEKAFVDALKEITKFLGSTEGAAAAQQFSNALSLIAKAVVFVAKNLEYVIPLLEVLLGYLAFKGVMLGVTLIANIAASLNAIAPSAGKATGAVLDFAKAQPILLRALGAVSAFFVGWEIGKWAYEKFAVVRQAGTWLVTGLDEIVTLIKGGWSMLFAALPIIAKNAMIGVLNAMSFMARKAVGLLATVASSMGHNDMAKALIAAADSIRIGYADVGDAIAGERAKMDAELARIRGIRKDMLADNKKDPRLNSTAGGGRGSVNPANVTPSNVTGFPDFPLPPVPPGGGAEAAAKKLESLKSEIARALDTLDGKIDKSQTDNLEKQLSAIEHQYNALMGKVVEFSKLGGATAGKEFSDHLNKSMGELRAQTIAKFNDNLEKDRVALLGKVEAAEASAGKKSALSLEDRQAAIRKSYEDTYREITKMRLELFNNNRDTSEADNAKDRLDASVKLLQSQEAVKFAQEELNRREARMNELLKLQDARVAAVNAQREVGKISDVKAAEDINKINADALPGIVAAGEATQQWALANAAIFAWPEDQKIFLAQLDAVILKAGQAKTKFTDIEKSLTSGVVKGVDVGLNAMVDSLQQVTNGQMSVMDGFRSIALAFGEFAAQFLREIAIMIIKQQIFNALKKSGNPVLIAAGYAGEATVNHAGGVVGSYSSGKRSRNVDTSWFANAPRYHSGGIPGLASDEYATILQKGEEVLTADSPRHILNGGATAGGAGAANTGAGMRVVLVDDRTKVAEAMSSAEGDRVIVQSIRRNLPTLKQLLKT